jgi:transposase
MPYLSSLTDKEWEIIEPLLPKKKRTKPPVWSKREILDGVLYQLKNGCNWCDLPKDLPPDSTVFWHYKHWRTQGVIEAIMNTLHGKVREQAKKAESLGCGCASPKPFQEKSSMDKIANY